MIILNLSNSTKTFKKKSKKSKNQKLSNKHIFNFAKKLIVSKFTIFIHHQFVKNNQINIIEIKKTFIYFLFLVIVKI